MQYRHFGKTGFDISALGFGSMRLPSYENAAGNTVFDHDKGIEVIHRAFERGVNYIDTAPGYCNRESEIIVGKALKGWRDKVMVSTKYPVDQGTAAELRGDLENSLKKLDVDKIDFYHMWGIGWDDYEQKLIPGGALEEARRAKEEGLIGHISFSFHDKPENMMRLADTGWFDSVLCQYNLLDRANEKAISYASEKGLGVVIMGPVAGGRLGAPSDKISGMIPGKRVSSAETALRFVLSHPGVGCALSGMSTIDMVEENAATCSLETPLSIEERANVMASLEENKRLAQLYCTGCNYCQPCPAGINIPYIFEAMNYHRIYQLTEYAKGMYGKLGEGSKKGPNFLACLDCGLCESKCPQKLEIRRQLRETHQVLG
nr:aldo/keto reductase [bacterium]